MHLLNQAAAGILILVLLGILVIIKRLATGSVLESPKGGFLPRLVNTLNLFFLLIANPLAAALLLAGRMDSADPTHVAFAAPPLLTALEAGGVTLYALGYFLMYWALIRLGSNYQLGGSSPRSNDRMITEGPYRLIRHPMYTAALCISLGLACMIQSLGYLFIFCAYLVLIVLLIPLEEEGLRRSYGEQFNDYGRKVKRLIPYLY